MTPRRPSHQDALPASDAVDRNHAQAQDSGGDAGDEPHPATRLESVADVRRAAGVKPVPPAHPQPRPAPPPESRPAEDAVPFRPSCRPPLGLLCVFDDGGPDGEWLRIRADKFVIGRAQCDLVIPHDAQMSSRHAEVSRQLDQGRYRWFLTDLESTNGTFLRVAHISLTQGQEILIGARRYRFEAGASAAAPVADPETAGTRGWQVSSVLPASPYLVELSPEGESQRFPLPRPENAIGSDSRSSAVVLVNDPMVSPLHGRISRDAKGRWVLQDNRSTNGTWARINRVALGPSNQFQLGEQRFLLKTV